MKPSSLFTTACCLLALACTPARTDDGGTPIQTQDAGVDGGHQRDAGVADTAAGAPCRSDADCGGVTVNAHCLTSTEAGLLGFSAPAGYCTSAWCDPSQDVVTQCGPNTRCGPLLGTGTFCERVCRSNSDCRTGYICSGGGCEPVFRGLLEGGTPPATDGGLPTCGVLGRECCPNSACYPGGVCIGGTCDTCEQSVCGNACVDKTSDPNNCGGCGWKCGARQACVDSACVVSSCSDGQALCSTSSGSACLDITSDINNCGGCGRRCDNLTATQTCENGSCHLQACVEGNYDCDGDPSNGCETFGICTYGTYDWCDYPNTCTNGNWCINDHLTGNQACMRPCSVDSDCPPEQGCWETLSTGAKMCAYRCSHGCPANVRCNSVKDICTP